MPRGMSPPQPLPFRCPFCSFTFDSVPWLVRHLRELARQQDGLHVNPSMSGLLVDCPLCGCATDGLVPHLEECHQSEGIGHENGQEYQQMVTLEEERGKATTTTIVVADKCHGIVGGGQQQRRIIDKIVDNKMGICGRQQFQCQFCGRLFGKSMDLKRHERIHTGERPFACPTCHCRFTLKQTLETHMNTHLSAEDGLLAEQPKCSVCQKHFLSKSALKLHLRVHTGEAPFKCQQCGAAFRTRKLMSTHCRNLHGRQKETGDCFSHSPNLDSFNRQETSGDGQFMGKVLPSAAKRRICHGPSTAAVVVLDSEEREELMSDIYGEEEEDDQRRQMALDGLMRLNNGPGRFKLSRSEGNSAFAVFSRKKPAQQSLRQLEENVLAEAEVHLPPPPPQLALVQKIPHHRTQQIIQQPSESAAASLQLHRNMAAGSGTTDGEGGDGNGNRLNNPTQRSVFGISGQRPPQPRAEQQQITDFGGRFFTTLPSAPHQYWRRSITPGCYGGPSCSSWQHYQSQLSAVEADYSADMTAANISSRGQSTMAATIWTNRTAYWAGGPAGGQQQQFRTLTPTSAIDLESMIRPQQALEIVHSRQQQQQTARPTAISNIRSCDLTCTDHIPNS